MTDWQTIQSWSSELLAQSASDIGKYRKQLVDQIDDLGSSMSGIGDAAEGEAIDAAIQKALTLQTSVKDLCAQTEGYMFATSTAAGDLVNIETAIFECFADAERYSLAISDGGVVSFIGGHDVFDYAPEVHSSFYANDLPGHISSMSTYGLSSALSVAVSQSRIQAKSSLEKKVSDTVSAANDADIKYRDALNAVSSGEYVASTQSDPNSYAFGYDKYWERIQAMSPIEVAIWWNALTEGEKEKAILQNSALIGNLDGIDYASRDRANKKLLVDMRADAIANNDHARLLEIDAITAVLYGKDENGAQKYLDPYGNPLKLISLRDNGKSLLAAIGIGDLDVADHVSVFVPGMGTTVEGSIGGYSGDMNRLLGEQLGILSDLGIGSQVVAGVAYLDYAAPGVATVWSTVDAKCGADGLTSFMEGLAATTSSRTGNRPHTTLMGHSYGSTTVGIAASRVATNIVDDLILFGSPGAGVLDTNEYNITGGAYVSGIATGNDAVQGIGPDSNFGKNPMGMEGFTNISNDKGAAGEGWLPGIKDHSAYLKGDTDIVKDIASIGVDLYEG